MPSTSSPSQPAGWQFPVTVVLGVMIDSPTSERAQNLVAALARLNDQTLDRTRYRIVLIEQGGAPRLETLVQSSIDEYVFAPHAGPFNRSWVLNIGAIRVSSGVICTFDADLIVPRDFLERGLLAWQCGAKAIRPFDQILYMDQTSTALVRHRLADGSTVDTGDPCYEGGLHPWSKGGCVWVDASLYRAMGGHDERFEGWGDEDRDFWVRLTRRTNVVTFPRRLLHLYHARDFETHPEVKANRLLLRALKAGLLPPQRGPIGDVQRYARKHLHDAFPAGRPHPMLAYTNAPRATSAAADTIRLEDLGAVADRLETLRCGDAIAAASDARQLLARGAIASTRGELEVARACLTRAACLNPSSVACWLALGRALFSLRRYDEALSAQLRALRLTPDSPAIYRDIARTLHAQRQLPSAAAMLREALYLDPSDAPTFSVLGDVLRRQAHPDEALEACDIAVRLDPDNAFHYLHLGAVFASRSAWAESLDALQRSLQMLDTPRATADPDATPAAFDPLAAHRVEAGKLDALAPEELRAELLTNAGDALLRLDRRSEAVSRYREALTTVPSHVRASRQLALALEFGGDRREAAPAWTGLGVVLQGHDRFDEARAAYQQALARKPDTLRAAINLGRVLLSLGDAQAAIRAFERALTIDPDHASTHTYLGMACCLAGDMDRGWREFAWFSHPHVPKGRPLEQPIWDGSPLDTHTLLVWADQALGDTIHWLRFLPPLKQAHPEARLILECQRNLVPLAQTVPGVDVVIGENAPLPPFDVHLPLTQVPVVCASHRHAAATQAPYLCVDSASIAAWCGLLERNTHRANAAAGPGSQPRLTVGLSWAGHPEGVASRQRFAPLAAFAPFAELAGVRFVSLQIGRQAAQILGRPGGLYVEQLQDDSHSTRDTAALMHSLDIVISVDTMIAHLAGALGRPVWLALPYVADWRWGHDPHRTSLYPTMRLFRQTQAGDWEGVFTRMRAALEQVVAAGSSAPIDEAPPPIRARARSAR